MMDMDALNIKKTAKKVNMLNIFKILKLITEKTNKTITFRNLTNKLGIFQQTMNNTSHLSIRTLLKNKRNHTKIQLILIT